VITSDIPTGKGGGEKANYFIIIVHLLSSFIIGYHHRKCGFDSHRPLKRFFKGQQKKYDGIFDGTFDAFAFILSINSNDLSCNYIPCIATKKPIRKCPVYS